MKIKDYIASLRLELGDCDDILFPAPLIIEWFNDALDEIYQMRPDIFSRTLVVKLQPGDLQKPCGCTYLQKVEAVTDHAGVKIRDIRKEAQMIKAALGLNFCEQSAQSVTSYDMALSDPTEFTVDPPVQPGQDIYVRVQCSKEPDPLPFDVEADACFPVAVRSRIKHYIRSRMYALETESQTSRQKSIDEMNLFMQLIGASRNAQAAYQANVITKLPSK